MEKIANDEEPLSESELEVKQHLAHQIKENLLNKLDIEEALKALTDKQRQCLILSVFEGLTEEEISQTLNISQPAVHKLIAKAKANMKKILQGGY